MGELRRASWPRITYSGKVGMMKGEMVEGLLVVVGMMGVELVGGLLVVV
jgi:hypothetical protein